VTIHAMAPVSSPDYSPLEETLGKLQSHNSELERFIDQLLVEISDLGQEVEMRASELIRMRQELNSSSDTYSKLNDEKRQLASQVQQRSGALAQAHAEIEQLRVKLREQEQVPVVDEAAIHQKYQSQIAELERRLSTSHPGPEPGAPSLQPELDRLKQELAAAKLELLKQHHAASPANDQAIDQLKQKNELLESELIKAQGHAVHLTETIDEQRKQINLQKSSVDNEIQAMRALLERRTAPPQEAQPNQSFADTSVISNTATATRDELEIRANSNNTVVDNVMAQFAKLQRDVNKRRSSQRK